MIYESPDGTLVQTDPDNTVRVAGDELVASSARAAFPASGLLNAATSSIADLLGTLKSLLSNPHVRD